nr:phospholipase-like protein [Tanacetum cinerariifolium]
MLRRHHKVKDDHHDMPLIYYMEGHTLHFGLQEFSLIISFHFGTDEEKFGKLSDDDAMRLCLFLALEISLFRFLYMKEMTDAKLQFTNEFSSMTFDLCDSLNSMFVDLIQNHDSDEDVAQDYLREEELRLCLEDEEMSRREHENLIVEENRLRMDEANRLRLEEENMLQLAEHRKISERSL